MINSEDKIRLMLQMMCIVMVWVAGLEWVAAVLLLAMLPWNPIYPVLRLISALGGWMAQPVAEKVEERLVAVQQPNTAGDLEKMLRVG
jgi:hypothetical protein